MESCLIFLTTIIDFLILSFFKNYDNESLVVFLILLNIFVVSYILLKAKVKYKVYILFSYLLRCSIMFFDNYGRDFFVLPHSGADTENFYNTGLSYIHLGNIWKDNLFGGLYSKLIGLTLKYIGDNRLFIQHFNIILSIFSIIILIKILNVLSVDYRVGKITIMIASYFPTDVIISSLILRESWIIFLSALGILYYIKYVYNEGTYNLFLSGLYLILSSMFHSGMIIILLAFIINEILSMSHKNIFRNILIIASILVILFLFRNMIFFKFTTQIEIILSRNTYTTEAGSRYLPNIYINSLNGALKYGWLKAIYFIVSPSILYWRGAIDIVSFFLDSLFYIIVVFKIVFTRKVFPKNVKIVYRALVISIILTVFVFGIGTSTAGTAMRHRNKLLILFLVVLAMIENYKLKENKLKHRRS